MIHSLLLCICLLGNAFLWGNCGNCSSRKILNGEEGYISDGPKDYEASSDCEWLIDAGGPNKAIHLTFEAMATECSFDYLFIYDGSSYTSKLIATLSGDSKPRPVVAFSGYMLIHLFSDRNYEKKGFEARYKVYDCPWDCSKRGRCEDHTCKCLPGYSGVGCQVTDCPNDCSNNGVCQFRSYTLQYCNCSSGYAGADCSLNLADDHGQGYWHHLKQGADRELPPRTSFTAAYVDECIWVFGGFDLNSVRDDLWKFCLFANHWEQLVQLESSSGLENENDSFDLTAWPEARSGHAAAVYGEGFYVFGGTLGNGSFSNELWYFNVTSLGWQRRAVGGGDDPDVDDGQLKVTGHTLTAVEDDLYLVGGKLEEQVFLDSLYRISALRPAGWERVRVRGGHRPPIRLVGHSTVYHRPSRSLLVFGGYSQRTALFSDRTHNLQALNVDDLYWTRLYNKGWRTGSLPFPRAYHSAVVMGNYLVVYGGNTHDHSNLEICYNQELFFYHLGCHVWVNHTYFTGDTIRNALPSKGRFGHAAVVVNGNMMFIIGGYSGQVLGDLVAYKVPAAVAHYQCPSKTSSCPFNNNPSEQSHCEIYTSRVQCQDDPECVFCNQGRNDSSPKHCVHRDNVEMCKDGDYHDSTARCPGICPAMHTCQACVSQGSGVNLTSAKPRDRIHIRACSWCVKEAQCQTRNEPLSTCKAPNETTSGTVGWWGGLSASLTSMHQCQGHDLPAGLHWVKYQEPMNTSFPDELSIIRKTKETKRLERKSNYTSKFRGFIHPLMLNTSLSGEKLMLMLGLTNAEAVLFLSFDQVPQRKEVVVNVSVGSVFLKTIAFRPSGRPVFPNVSRGHKYFVEQVISQILPSSNFTTKSKADETTMTLGWNRGVRLHKKQLIITSEFLEPFSNGTSCADSYNCLQCLTDVLCSWCEVTRSCLPRNSSSEMCRNEEDDQYLITSPSECPSCANHVQCSTCATDPLCEWTALQGHCTRRYRTKSAFRNSSECPPPCLQRKNCSDCILNKGECAWCKNTQTCLPFSDYVSRYVYGQCTSWLDGEEIREDCRSCHNYTTCKGCLREFGCGWCANDFNPQLGLCLPGDFTGKYGSHTCSQTISESLRPATWSYDQCPDVDECILGLHKCHANATCVNQFEGYVCECNRGFEGDGMDQCNETCYYDCVNGKCSGAPGFACSCDLGWTNYSCEVNCGCNNHSSCSEGVGICDRCYNHTTGKACDQCIPGTYGDPADIAGCTPCICNGHGDAAQGSCNSTGQCYCVDNTNGDQCDLCKPGYYGNPRNGGKCYLQCDHRVYVTNITEGSLGSYQGSTVLEDREHVYCLWILSTLPYGHYPPYTSDIMATIELTIEGVDLECGQDAVYVYDGVPPTAKSDIRLHNNHHSMLLAVFCGRNVTMGYGNKVYGHSGILSVYFEGDFMRSMNRGFNASYRVYSCPDGCLDNQMCQDGWCVCKPGFWGQGCTTPFCPANCSEGLKQGRCSRRMCDCELGFGGLDCRYPADDNELDLHLLSDSRLSQTPIPEQKQSLHCTSSEDDDDFGPSPRAGHSLTTCGDGLIFLFGGYSLECGILKDMWMYNTTSMLWKRIIPTTTSNPGPRYHHAAACIPFMKTLYILAGFEALDHQRHPKNSKSLWKFNIQSYAWSYHDTPSGLPPMAGHTLTYVGAANLMVIGGFSSEDYFNDKVFEYNAPGGLMAWQMYTVESMKGAVPIGLYGHSSVYDPTTHTMYIYGGYLFHRKEWAVSDKLFTFDVRTREWNIIQPELTHHGFPPAGTWDPRVFHAATHVGDGMVVIGGLAEDGNLGTDVLFFRYDCSTWHRIHFEHMDVELEHKTVSALGLRAVNVGNATYVFGGFTGLGVGALTKVTLPRDVCSLILDPATCRNTSGCQTCTYILETGVNKTICYDSFTVRNTKPPGCVGPPPEEKHCDLHNHRRRPCKAYPTCSTCLATHPRFKEAGLHCHWCTNCRRSFCASIKELCLTFKCEPNAFTIQSPSECTEHTCPASDCVRCQKLDNCVWSRHFKRSSEVGLYLSKEPVYDWNCMTTNHKLSTTDEFRSMSSNGCPKRCSEQKSCKTCLDSPGSEGGSKSCLWNEVIEECMAPAYVPLRCSLGECGYLYKGHSSSCPVPCEELKKCADCIKSKACGWNARLGKNGEGTCMAGTMSGPDKKDYQERSIKYSEHRVHLTVTGEDSSMSEDLLWSYDWCQPENECLNGHHTCDADTEDCIDTLKHFRCQCKHGYVRAKTGRKCEPVCHQGCVHGTCVQMDKCQCHFGWVGSNCSVECLCNKHSYCENIYKSDNCTSCQNSTKGPRCQYCKPLFVGNPINGGYCEPCLKFCHDHSKICMTKREYEELQIRRVSYDLYGNNTYPSRGPSRATALCFECQHNTTGLHCDRCTSGHFRKHSEPKSNPCMACHCNGHSNMCNADTGENCQCKNNTETNCDSKDQLECWKHQCAHCKEYFQGKPTDAHQCYRQMNVDRDYCFDPDTQNNCNQYPQPLRLGRTVFFAVQPKYLNVDIRITIDVTMGAADIFLSNKMDTFQVLLNKRDWHHDIFLDKMYTSNGASLARRSLHGGTNTHGDGHGTNNADGRGGRDDNLTVNDEPSGGGSAGGAADSEAILITEEIPEFLKIHHTDPAYYKLSQYRNIDEWGEGFSEGDEDNTSHEEKKERSPKEEAGDEWGEEEEDDGDKPGGVFAGSENGNVVVERTHPSSPDSRSASKWKKKKKNRSGQKNHHNKRIIDIRRSNDDGMQAFDFLKALDEGTLDDRLAASKEHRRNLSRWIKKHRKFYETPSYGMHRDKQHAMPPHFGKKSDKKTGVQRRRLRRGVTVTDSRGGKNAALYNGQIKVGEINAGALNTYITANQQNSVLVVRNVHFRLVITLPRDQHDLKNSRFYIIVRSRGGKGNNSTCGNLYFRQDQPHIDLFVFFSVFFSCFFLFLALCVMFWKLRQSFDARRSRQMREREMECMASRPFARILVLLESDGSLPPALSTGLMRRRSRLNRGQNRNPYSIGNNTDMHGLTISSPPLKDLGINPIAVEPTDDGLAAVATVLFQLPGGAVTHSHLCLGSSLTTRMVTAAPSQKVANLRRRTSASSC